MHYVMGPTIIKAFQALVKAAKEASATLDHPEWLETAIAKAEKHVEGI